jgi:autotransporter translocation and assembly factor TamB
VTCDRAVLVDTRDMRIAVSGDARMEGTITAPVVRGRLRFGGCRYVVPQDAFAAGSRSAIRLTPGELRELEETFTYVGTTTPGAVAAFYDRADLDLALVFERNNWVSQTTPPRFSAEITGEVQLKKPPRGELSLAGRLEPTPRRGFVEQFGRTFDLAGGEVLLNGGMKAHTMDIRADYGNRGGGSSSGESDVIVHLDLQGRFDEMRLILSSEPALSETDIVNYIATGRTPTARVGGTQDSQSSAASLGRDIGLSQVTGALEGPAKQTVGLDVLKVRYDAIEGATLVAGRYMAPQVYVGFQQPLQAMDTTNENNGEQYQTRVELDYAAYRWLALNVQAETSLMRTFLRFKREY